MKVAPRWTERAIPVLCMGLVLVLHWAWLQYNTAVETWDDDAGLFRLAICFEESFRGSTEPCSAGAPYPPLMPLVTSLHFLATGARSLAGALASLWPFLLLLCGALYVGLRRAAGTMAGLAGIAMGPVVVWSLHIRGKYYTEVPLAALVVASVVALAATDRFQKRWPSAVLGIFLGLGLLTKWSFAFFLGPAAAIAVAIAIATPFQRKSHRICMTAVAIAVPLLIAGGAADRIPYGLTIGLWTAIALGAGLLFIARRSPDLVAPTGPSRWTNVGICVGLCVLIAGPWYWTYLPAMQEFLAANLAQKFHGDPLPMHMGWPFYPAVLLTRVMSSPLCLLFLTGVGVGLRRSPGPLWAWSLLALLCGIVILGLLPYRSGRYLIAGLGLIVPVVVLGLAQFRSVARVGLPILFAAGFVHQASWIPLAFGGAHLPHHLTIFTLPERDLMGNTHQGVYQAYQDLLHPRWRFLPVASPPIQRTPPSARLARLIHADSGETAHFVVVSDDAGRLNLNAMRTHMLALGPPPTSEIVSEPVQQDLNALRALQHRARHPRDQPATSQGPASPRELYIVTTWVPEHGPKRGLTRLLHAQGWSALDRNGVIEGFEPMGTTVWKAPVR
jgi:hypothetical protein